MDVVLWWLVRRIVETEWGSSLEFDQVFCGVKVYRYDGVFVNLAVLSPLA